MHDERRRGLEAETLRARVAELELPQARLAALVEGTAALRSSSSGSASTGPRSRPALSGIVRHARSVFRLVLGNPATDRGPALTRWSPTSSRSRSISAHRAATRRTSSRRLSRLVSPVGAPRRLGPRWHGDQEDDPHGQCRRCDHLRRPRGDHIGRPRWDLIRRPAAFSNQLAGILCDAELLLHRTDDPRHGEVAARIVTAGELSAELTRQLLAGSRRGRYRLEPVDLRGTVEEVVALLERRLGAPRSTTRGDPAQLRSALPSLAVDAQDAMPEGGTLTFGSRTVTLGPSASPELLVEVPPGEYVCLEVRDAGVGTTVALYLPVVDAAARPSTVPEAGEGSLSRLGVLVVDEEPTVRVVLSSGSSVEDAARRLVAEGARGFVQKPFSLATLGRAVERAV